ncbi:MAG: response regulator [Spongiibacteraceae bacterium]
MSTPLLNEGGVVILNVDDSDKDRLTKTRALEHAGFRVVEAATGGDALELVAAKIPDLVVLDMNLRDMDGLEVCRRIKENPATASTLVLQTSAVLNGTLDKIRSLEGGADNYLTGPVESLELVANVRALLRLRDVQRELHENEERFRQMAENIGDVFWIFEPESPRMLYVSPAYEKIWGRSTGRLFKNFYAWQESIHPADRERVSHAFSQLLNYGHYEQDYRLLMPDGSERWVRDRGFPVSDETGRNYRITRISQDISAFKIAELALQEAAVRKDEFLATLAHELRNPLAPMRTAIDLMRMNSAVDTVNGSTREIISRQIDHLVRLVDDLLDVSRITQGKLSLQKEFIELSSVIDAAIELNTDYLQSRQHRLTLNMPSTNIWLKADSVRMTQVIGNLLHNAAKYTPERGEIVLSARVDGNHLRIDVSDNGIGISADRIHDIFNLFTQAQRLQNKAPEGLGVGLSLVRHLVELHGGTIEAHSHGAGLGSTFSVNLPINSSLPISSPKVDNESPKRLKRIKSLRILLVDDSVDAVGLLKILLERLGHEVEVAHEGITAIELAKQFQPQVILLDIGLPGIDGYQVARRLKAIPELQGTQLVALTGYGQDRDREHAFASGFAYHMIKPLDMDMLSDLLQRVTPDAVPSNS